MPLTPPLPYYELTEEDERDIYPPVRRIVSATEAKPLMTIAPTSAFDMAAYLDRLEIRMAALSLRKKPGRKPKPKVVA